MSQNFPIFHNSQEAYTIDNSTLIMTTYIQKTLAFIEMESLVSFEVPIPIGVVPSQHT